MQQMSLTWPHLSLHSLIISWTNKSIEQNYVSLHTNKYKKAVLSQGNRAMPQLLFSDQSLPTTFTTSFKVAPKARL